MALTGKSLYTKTLPLMLVAGIILLNILGYYFGSAVPSLKTLASNTKSWSSIITSWVLIYTYVVLLIWHTRRLMKGQQTIGRRAFVESICMVGIFVGILLWGLATSGLNAASDPDFILIMSYLAFAGRSSQHWLHDGYASFRRVLAVNLDTAVFLIAYLSGMAYQIPAIQAVMPQIETIAIWFEDVPAKAVQRGGFISMAVFGLMMVLRAITLKEPGLIELEAE
jgi:hypothetical protein